MRLKGFSSKTKASYWHGQKVPEVYRNPDSIAKLIQS